MQIGKIKEEEMEVNLEEKAKQFGTKGKKIYSRYFFYSVYLFVCLFIFETGLNSVCPSSWT